MKSWLAIVMLLAGIAAAWALPPSNQIIMFGKGSSASNPPPPTSTCSSGALMNGVFDLTNTCNDIYFIGALK